jgi:hypothetical protein
MIANRVKRACIDDLKSAGQVTNVKRSMWVTVSGLTDAS